jgi:hypothetical protein
VPGVRVSPGNVVFREISMSMVRIALEHFGHALWIWWLWIKWKHLDKPCCVSDLPTDRMDEALFVAATRVQVGNGKMPKF